LAKGYIESLETLAERTETVHTIAQEGHWESLLSALADRQTIMDAIDALPSEALDLGAKDLVTASQILERVEAQHRQIVKIMQASAVALREELEAGDRVRTSAAAYGRNMSTSTQAEIARFMDKQK